MIAVNAIVMAGGRNGDAMRAATGVEYRALTPLGERTMLDYVLDALRGCAGVEHVLVVGAVPVGPGYDVIPPGRTLVDNLFAGLEAVGGERPVLVVTSDIPFLTAAAVGDFVARAAATGADFCYPIIPLAICQSRFPLMRRTSLKVREGVFTGGNLILLAPRVLREHRETILRAYAARKSPAALGRMLGWGLVARLLLSQVLLRGVLTLHQLEKSVSRLLGCRAAAVVTEFAEIGADVDKPEDVAAARAMLAPAL